MNTTDWKGTAELIGFTAIVASLIFVGLQLKQSQAIAIAAQYQERANAAVDMYMGHIQSDTSLKVWGERLQSASLNAPYPGELGAWMEGKAP